MEHLTIAKILDYVGNRIGDEQAFEIDNHLAGCQECARRVHAHYYLRDHFDEVWNTWTGINYVEEYWQARVSEGLSGAKVPAGLRQRAKDWLGKIKGTAGFAVGVLIDASKEKSKIVQEGLEFFREAGSRFNFVPAPVPLRTRGAVVRTRGARRTTGETDAKTILVQAPGPPWTKISIDPTTNKISVQIERIEEPWPLLMLLPKKEGEPMINQFRQPKGADYLLAEFENVLEGEYVLLSEPVPFHEKSK